MHSIAEWRYRAVGVPSSDRRAERCRAMAFADLIEHARVRVVTVQRRDVRGLLCDEPFNASRQRERKDLEWLRSGIGERVWNTSW